MSSRPPHHMFRSSSLGDSVGGLFTRIQHSEPPVASFEWKRTAPVNANVSKAPAVAEKKKKQQLQQKPRQSIFFLESLEREKKNDMWSRRQQLKELEFGEAFKTCFLCRKELPKEKDLYVYRYVAAFCSPECREDQIALDGFEKEIAEDVQRICAKYADIEMPRCRKF